MDLKAIEALLDKYYRGETTLKEERKLEVFFNGRHVPPHLEAEKIKFQFYYDALNEGIGETLDERLTTRYKTITKIRPFIYYRYFKAVSGMAAGILILLGVSLFLYRDGIFKKKNIYGTYDNPQIAYAQTRKALLLISQKLDKGNKSLGKLGKLNEMETLIKNK